jgi:hypothetical protein
MSKFWAEKNALVQSIAESVGRSILISESWTSESRSRENGCSFAGKILVQRTPLTRWVFWQVWQRKNDSFDSATPWTTPRLPWLRDSAATSLTPWLRCDSLDFLDSAAKDSATPLTPRSNDSATPNYNKKCCFNIIFYFMGLSLPNFWSKFSKKRWDFYYQNKKYVGRSILISESRSHFFSESRSRGVIVLCREGPRYETGFLARGNETIVSFFAFLRLVFYSHFSRGYSAYKK